MSNIFLEIINNIDWTPYFITNYFIIDYMLKNDNKNYKVDRNKKIIKDSSEILLPPELIVKHKNINFEELNKEEFGQSLVKFYQIILNNFSSRNLINFYNNLNELKIDNKKMQSLMFRKKFDGAYYPFYNKIFVNENEQNVVLPHELFHMASSFYDENRDFMYSGFSQMINFKTIGNGINEGYTECMVERYYGYDFVKTSAQSYRYLEKITELLEFIIGKSKMEELYLNANLKGLIDELSNYVEVEDSINFIKSTDFIYNKFDKKSLTDIKVRKNIEYINEFLVSLYASYAAKKYVDNKISLPELKTIINRVLYNLDYFIPITKKLNKNIDDILKKYHVQNNITFIK